MPGRHPWPACKTKSRRQSPQVGRDMPAFPARWFDGLYVVSPGTGSLAPVAGNARNASSPTWPQHREARTARFHRRIGYVRPREQTHAATRHAHRIPHPTSVTIAKRPLIRGGIGASNHNFRKSETEIFLREGLDSPSRIEVVWKIGGLPHVIFDCLNATGVTATPRNAAACSAASA